MMRSMGPLLGGGGGEGRGETRSGGKTISVQESPRLGAVSGSCGAS